MKKNAILIAGILCVAQTASLRAQSDDYENFNARGRTIQNTENINRTPQGAPAPSEISTASQHDPAAVDPTRADSSIRGGSNEARGGRTYSRSDYDTAARPMNPALQADSSIRGGSFEARNRDWNSKNTEPGSPQDEHRLKADSSIRGGSNEARGYNWRSDLSDDDNSDVNSDGEVYLFFFDPDQQVQPGHLDSGAASNWNPSDDLMEDNTESSGKSTDLSDKDRGVLSEQNGQKQSPILDDMEGNVGTSAQYETGNDSMPQGGLNYSRQLEKDISGEYNLEDRVDSANPKQPAAGDLSPGKSASQIQAERADQNSQGAYDSSFNSSRSTDIAHGASSSLGTEQGLTGESDEAVGGPGSTEVGSNSSSDADSVRQDIKKSDEDHKSDAMPEYQSGINTESQNHLFKNNRAQGVGSLATGEFGVANSDSTTSSSISDDALAGKVKASLVKESTGVTGVTKSEARNIQVTAKGHVVTLKGAVPTERDRKMVEVRAAEVAGVHKVDNQLTVSEKANPVSRDLNSGSNLEDQTDRLQH